MSNTSKFKNARRKARQAIIPVLDILMSPLTLLSAVIMKRIKKIGVHNLPLTKNILLSNGVFPIIDHYYEPRFNYKHLTRPLDNIRELPGIRWNIDTQLSLFDELDYTNELSDIPDNQPDNMTFYWNNGAFPPGDAIYWYNIIRYKKPRRIIEIGSGKSTLVAIKALTKNVEEDPNYNYEHICIEPYAAPWLEQTPATIVRSKVEDIDKTIFHKLGQDDILFIDSSHIIRPQGDVLFEYLEILPVLNKGVIVHIHDIFSPRDYPEAWLVNNVSFWNEQYLLEAFLTENNKWEIIGSLNFLFNDYKQNFLKSFPMKDETRDPHSFYIQKI